MANLKIYLADTNGQTIMLDTEDVQVKQVYSVNDFTDISIRKQDIMQVDLKGTDTNNRVLGNLYQFNHQSGQGGLFANFNVLIPPTAYVYQNEELTFVGTFRVTQIKNNKGNINYACVITNSVTDLVMYLQDKKLEDYSYSAYTHEYTLDNIIDSWTNATTEYKYPCIDYGYTATTIGWHNVKNFKSSLSVKGYLDVIFGDAGYTWEIDDTPEFIEQFNHVYVPDCQLGNQTTLSGLTLNNTRLAGFRDTQADSSYTQKTGVKNLFINIAGQPTSVIGDVLVCELTNMYLSFGRVQSSFILKALRGFQSTSKVDLTFTRLVDNENQEVSVYVQLVRRTKSAKEQFNANYSSYGVFDVEGQGLWEVIGTSEVIKVLARTSILTNTPISFVTPSNTFNVDDEISVRVYSSVENIPGLLRVPNLFYFDAVDLNLQLPASATVKIDVIPTNTGYGDQISIVPPVNIKVTEFLKTIINQFNLMIYPDKENRKKIWLSTYDYYYRYCQPQNLTTFALDWTNKCDWKEYTLSTNVSLPKSYDFVYTTDTDYLTETYKKKYNQDYGSLTFIDSLGNKEKKEVKLITSPVIPIQESIINRVYMALYAVKNGKKELAKTNIRFAYWNGVKAGKLDITNPDGNSIWYTSNVYPQMINYYTPANGTGQDIHFNQPIEVYFSLTQQMTESPTSYTSYYVNQTSELVSPNLTTLDIKMWLNPWDIANLDLRYPVLIKSEDSNHEYWKVINIDYVDDGLSIVKLQKIV